jgi:hypothetical protein
MFHILKYSEGAANTENTDCYYERLADEVINVRRHYAAGTYYAADEEVSCEVETYTARIGRNEADLSAFNIETELQAIIGAAVILKLDALLAIAIEPTDEIEYPINHKFGWGFGFANADAIHELYKNKEHVDRVFILTRAIEAAQLLDRKFITADDIRLSAEALSFEVASC